MTHEYNWYWRLVRGFAKTTGTCDSNGDISAPKMGAFCTLNVALYVACRKLEFTAGTSFVVSISIASLWGRSVFLHALDRGSFSFNRQDTSQRNTNMDVKADAAAILSALPNLWRDDESGAVK